MEDTLQCFRPEAFLGYFSPASDLYSIGGQNAVFCRAAIADPAGIILYLLMAGKMPFDNSVFQEADRFKERKRSSCISVSPWVPGTGNVRAPAVTEEPWMDYAPFSEICMQHPSDIGRNSGLQTSERTLFELFSGISTSA